MQSLFLSQHVCRSHKAEDYGSPINVNCACFIGVPPNLLKFARLQL